MDSEDMFEAIFHHEKTPEHSMHLKVHQIIFLTFCAIGILADLLIFYTIVRFKNMRTVPNIFLANWVFADFCYLLGSFSFHTTILAGFTLFIAPICWLIQTIATFRVIVTLFVFIILLDWFIAAYLENLIEKFRKCYVYVTVIFWLFGLTFAGTSPEICAKLYYSLVEQFYYYIYWIISIFISVIQIFIGVQNCRSKFSEYSHLMLTLVGVFVMTWLPGSVNSIAFLSFGFHQPIVHKVMGYIALSDATLNLLLLLWFYKDFRVHLLEVLKCSSCNCSKTESDVDDSQEEC